jgi:hypothetical protein
MVRLYKFLTDYNHRKEQMEHNERVNAALIEECTTMVESRHQYSNGTVWLNFYLSCKWVGGGRYLLFPEYYCKYQGRGRPVCLQVKEGALICGHFFALFNCKENLFQPLPYNFDALYLNINLFGLSLSYSSLSPQLGGMGLRPLGKKGEIIAKERSQKFFSGY